MKAWMIISMVLFLVCIAIMIYLLRLKWEIRKAGEELPLTRDRSYNRQLTISLFDRDFMNLVVQINRNLDCQKQMKLETEQSERKLKQSISDIAHDLRTPLTVIKGNLQMLDRDFSGSEKERSYLDICLNKTDALKEMVEDFFEMSVLESDHTPIEGKEVNATNLLMQFIADHETVIREHNLTPEIRFPARSVILCGDEQMLLRMLGNLLNNILKYGKDSFRISMEVTERGNPSMCRIAFANRVDGDADLDAEHLFDRTYRGNQARPGSGAGLGLYIVKLLAEKQGGRVYAACSGEELEIGFELPGGYPGSGEI